ncbi:MAG: SPOR domain-containing protein, partial [Rhodospirillaceae bacterium]
PPPAPKGALVLPLTRPVVTASMAAMAVSGASLFLAGMATGFGMGVPATAAPEPASVVQSVEIAPRLIAGELAPPAPPPLPTTDDVEIASVMVAALAEPAPVAPPPPPQHYAIQTGAFGVAANAERQSAELRRLGFEPHTAGQVGSRGVALTVVYAGRYDSRADAELKAKTLQKAGIQTYVTALAD